MNLKTKALGLVAGTALALGLANGALADTGDTTATLNPQNGGACTAVATTGEIDLGTWEWTGSAYALQNTPTGSLTIKVNQNLQPNRDCNVLVGVSPLTFGSNPLNTIPAANVVLNATAGSTGAGPTFTVSTPTGTTGTNLVLAASLTSVPSGIAPGVYLGEITVTSATAAP